MKTKLTLILFWFVVVTLEVLIHLWFLASIVFSTKRATAIILGYDRLGNIAMGQGNETISSNAGRLNRWYEPIIDKLFEWLGDGKNHCKNNIEKRIQ
jgi:hypothetical protein